MANLAQWRAADDEYRYGRCADLAWRLSQQLGLPMAVLVDGTWNTYSVGHAFVADGNHAIDIRGRRPITELRAEWSGELYGRGRLIHLDEQRARQLVGEWRVFAADKRRDETWIRNLLACDLQPPHMHQMAAAA